MATGAVELANQNGASRSLYNGFYGGRDFEPRIGFAYTPAFLGNRTVIRGAFTISSYLEGTGTNLRLPQNSPFTPAQINTLYNGSALPSSNTTDGFRPRLRTAAAQTTPALLAPFSISGIPTSAGPRRSVEPRNPAPILGRYHLPDWLRRPARNPPDGAVLLYAKKTTSQRHLRDYASACYESTDCAGAMHRAQPVLRQEPNLLQHPFDGHRWDPIEWQHVL